jgi:hypothetical protein
MRPVPATMLATAALLAVGISLPLDESQAQANDGVVMTTPPSPPRLPRAEHPQSWNPQPQQGQTTNQPQLQQQRGQPTNHSTAAHRSGAIRPQ